MKSLIDKYKSMQGGHTKGKSWYNHIDDWYLILTLQHNISLCQFFSIFISRKIQYYELPESGGESRVRYSS